MNKQEFEKWIERDINSVLMHAQWRFDYKGERYPGGLVGFDIYCRKCPDELKPIALRIYSKLQALAISCMGVGFVYEGLAKEFAEELSQEGLLDSQPSCRESALIGKVTF